MITATLHDTLHDRDLAAAKLLLQGASIDEIISAISELDDTELALAFRLLDKPTATAVFDRIPHDDQRRMLLALSRSDAAEILAGLPVDDAAALLDELPAPVAKQLISGFDTAARSDIAAVLRYPAGSVGRHANPKVIEVAPTDIVDDAMDAIAEDVTDTMMQKAGVADPTHLKDTIRSEKLIAGSIAYPLKVRLAFLMVTLAGGLAVGGLIDRFEDVLAAIVAVAVFIPLVMDMGGNVGTQSTTIFARGLALGHIDLTRFRRHLAREVRVGLTMAIILGTIGGTVAWAWQGAPNDIPQLGIVVGIALAFSVTFAAFLGFFLPWLLLKIGADHAPGADPFITTIKDFSGLAVYFLLASWLLGITT